MGAVFSLRHIPRQTVPAGPTRSDSRTDLGLQRHYALKKPFYCFDLSQRNQIVGLGNLCKECIGMGL